MSTITKKELVERIAEKRSIRRAVVKELVQDFLDVIVEELARGNRLEFREFGVFEIRERSARVAQNPKTMQRVQVPAKLTVRFKSGREMRKRLESNGALGALHGLVQVKPGRMAGAAV